MSKELIEQGYDVIDNSYFAKKADIVNANVTEYRIKYGLPNNFFLTSNRFIPKKNLFRLLEAYKKYVLHQGDKSWHLVMLGDGELKQALQKKVTELGLQNKVIMPGFLQYDTLPYYYALAKAFIHASTSEQWGLVVNEAMSVGLPVIVSDQCGCSENLVKDGTNGFLFNPFQTEQLADKMIELGIKTEDQLSHMGEMSREIISRLDPKIFGENTKKLIDKLRQKEPASKSLLGKLILNLVIKFATIK
jgi:glycosyltransferase involved in cell wall biosynthesis